MATDDAKSLSRSQFGANAANYATSPVHAKGASLDRMVEVTAPQAHWRGLDIATAAGHTAFAFAPHVAEMVATDLTPEMVELCASRAAELGYQNVTVQQADAEALPFDDAAFDLVSCRIAPHHFPNPGDFISEVERVLKPNGVFVMVDNVVPANSGVADVYNSWEKTRDPSHVRALSIAEWVDLCAHARLAVMLSEDAPKQMSFSNWVENMSVPMELRPGLLRDLLDANADVAAFLQPSGTTQSDASFVLTEGLVLASKPER